MAAAYEIPIAGAGQCMAIFGIVNQKDLSSAELQARVRAVVANQPAARLRQVVERNGIAQIVAVNDMYRQSRAQRGSQRLRANHITAMDDDLRTCGRSIAYRAGKRLGPIVAVRDDADLHELS